MPLPTGKPVKASAPEVPDPVVDEPVPVLPELKVLPAPDEPVPVLPDAAEDTPATVVVVALDAAVVVVVLPLAAVVVVVDGSEVVVDGSAVVVVVVVVVVGVVAPLWLPGTWVQVKPPASDVDAVKVTSVFQ